MATALTATLRADITQFERAIQQAETKISGLQRSTTQVNRELAKFGNEFGGANLIRQANSMAKAVEDIGGVTKLTTTEQKRLSSTVDEALAKYRALGQEVPPKLVVISTELHKIRTAQEAAEKSARELAAAQRKAAGETEAAFKGAGGAGNALAKGLRAFGPTLAAAFSVGAVISFGKELVALGSQITDLSSRMGVGVEAAQEIKFALDQTGSSAEGGARAIAQMGDRLTEGKDSTVAALKSLNLELDTLRNLKPEDAFTAIAEAIKDVPDPMRQTQLAMELFGKSGVEILPAIKQGLGDLREEAKKLGQVLSEDDVKALDDFGDKWDATTTQMQVAAVKAATGIADAFKQSWTQILADQATALASQIDSFAKFRAVIADPNKLVFGAAAGLLATGARTKGARAANKPDLDDAEAVDQFRAAMARSAVTATDYAEKVKGVGAASKAAAKEQRDAAADAKKVADEIDKLTGRDAITRAKDLQKTLAGLNLNNLDPKKAQEVSKAFELAIKTAERLGDEVPQIWRDIADFARQPIQAAKLFTDGLYKAHPAIRGLGLEMDKQTERMVLGLMNVTGSVEALNSEFLKQPLKAGDWSNAINDLSQSFSSLAQIGGDAFGGIARQIGEVIALMGVGAQAGKTFRDAFWNPTAGKVDPRTGKPMGGFDFSALGGGQGTGAAISAYTSLATTSVAAYGALDQATNVKGRGNRTARGALTGAAIGNSIVPGYGALVGAAVGALVGAFRNPAFEDVYNRVAHNFGVKLSDETAKGIAKLAKADFKGDRGAAEIFSLDTIIGEGGGLKDSNIKQLTRRLRDAFSLEETGKFSADQLTDVLNKNFGSFADFVGRSTEIAGKGFSEIARLAKAAGVDIASINKFVGEQTGRVGGGLEALSGPLFEAAGLSEQIKAAEAAQRSAAEAVAAARGGKSDEDLGVGDRQAVAAAQQEQEAAAKALADITAKMAAGTKDAQAEFDRLGIIAVGAFNAARASGLGFLEATDQLGPGLDRLVTIQDQLGLSGNAALSELLKFRDLVGTNETVVASAEALNETILALSNIGGLTTDTLAALEGQGLETFDRLTAAGFTSGQSIEVMRDFIENMKLAHEQLGVPIDANTQALIDQADALAGLTPKNPTEALTQGFENVVTAVNRLAKGLGIDVPEAANAAAAAVEGATKRSGTAAVDAANVIAKKTGDAFIELERKASKSQDGVSDKIREAAERGIVAYKRLADEANMELSRIDREVDIRFRYLQSGDLPSGGGDVPGLASGGVVRARAGGTIVRVGEGGRDEAVIPLGAGGSLSADALEAAMTRAISKVQFTGTLEGGGRPLLRYVSREVGSYIETRTGQRVPL